MRIMEIVSGRSINGAIVNCLEVSRALRDRGHEVTLVCRPGAWIAKQVDSQEILVVECDLKRRPDRLRKMARVAQERNIDLIHTHMSSANFFGVLLRRLYGIPYCIASAHNRYFQLHWMLNDRVIAVSEATRKYHQRYNMVRPSRIKVVHNFIDDQKFHRVPSKVGLELRTELNIDSNSRVMGIIGDVIPRKGLIHLVRSLPRVVDAVPDCKLVCVGYEQPKYAAEVKAEARRLGVADRILWLGVRNAVHRILSMLDLYVLPSIEESMPLAILEAMASRLPVVASAVGGIPECVVHGKTGMLVPPAQAAPLADAVIQVLQDIDVAQSMGDAGRDRVRQEFSIESQIPRIENVFAAAG